VSHLHLHLHSHLVRPVRVGSGILPDQVARRVVGYMILAVAMVHLALSVITLRIPRARQPRRAD